MFQLPKEVSADIENYRYSLKEVKAKKMPLSRFKGIRVPWGFYSQRGGKIYMSRVRVPASVVTAEQLRALACASLKYGNNSLHITTREDIQIHNVKLEDTIKIMDFLKKYNLSPRGGGGNTVRNVIACSLAGVCKEEVFDVRSDAIGLTEYLLRQESSFKLPRKFKVSFSGCSKDCSGALINDVGLLAQKQDGKDGFLVFVGGGLGASSRIGQLLDEFIPREDLGYCVSAIKNIFYKKGDRRNKHRNRLRFLIEDMRFAKFKQLYRQEFEQLKESEHIALRKIDFIAKESSSRQLVQKDDREYQQFLKYNAQAQKQEGFSSIEIRISCGDIQAQQLTNLANLDKEFKGIGFRTTQNQNLILVDVSNSDVYKLYLKLKEIWPEFTYPQSLLDVVVCKGAVTCNLGLCNSPALAIEIEKLIASEFLETKIVKALEIKLNGCPNACGHQPIGKLSFHGLVRRVDNKPVPFYKVFLAGRKEGRSARLATEAGVVVAKSVINFLREFLQKLNETIDLSQDVDEFLKGEALGIARGVLEKYAYVPSYSENKDFYIDWGREEEFSLSGLGQGECGSGVLDIIEADLAEAKLALEEAHRSDYDVKAIKKSLFLSVRSLLIVKGTDPRDVKQALVLFKENFIDTQLVAGDCADVENVLSQINFKLNLAQRKQKFDYAKKFLQCIGDLYKNMDSSFNFLKQKTSAQETAVAKKLLDLKGTPCPINYVKTKLVLENMNSGAILEVLLDEGEPMDNVPKSLENDGHKIIKIEKQDGFYKVVVKKQ